MTRTRGGGEEEEGSEEEKEEVAEKMDEFPSEGALETHREKRQRIAAASAPQAPSKYIISLFIAP
jgi:hypothetical protein